MNLLATATLIPSTAIYSAPEVQVNCFNLNPLDNQYFKSVFWELVEKTIDDPLGKLARLIQYTLKGAKELFNTALKLLSQ